MASLSGNSSGSTQIHKSGSEGDITEQRKRKRMQSNRESARRSRLRKQQHLDELDGQVSKLKKENEQMLTKANITTQHCMNLESENHIMRAQMDELSKRLESLNDIVNYMKMNNIKNSGENDSLMNHWYLNQQPIMACAEMFEY